MTDPDETRHVAGTVLKRAEQSAHRSAQTFTVFEYLGTFGVVAVPAVIRAILGQPEVLSAMSAEQSHSGSFDPVADASIERKRSVRGGS
jgi:hypothetical protein